MVRQRHAQERHAVTEEQFAVGNTLFIRVNEVLLARLVPDAMFAEAKQLVRIWLNAAALEADPCSKRTPVPSEISLTTMVMSACRFCSLVFIYLSPKDLVRHPIKAAYLVRRTG